MLLKEDAEASNGAQKVIMIGQVSIKMSLKLSGKARVFDLSAFVFVSQGASIFEVMKFAVNSLLR